MMKKLKENKIFSEKGSVTLFVLIAIIFFLIVSLNIYSSNKNKIVEQSKEIQAIEENYNTELENMDEIYDNLVNGDLKTVFIKQSSINSPNKIYYNLSEWTNENVIAKVTVSSENNHEAQLYVKVISKRTGNTITYNENQVNNNEVIITENSTVIVTFGNKEQRFELTKFDKEIPTLSYESLFINGGKYVSETWTNKETYTKISVIEEISGISEMYYSSDKQNWTKFQFRQSNGIYQELNKYCGKETWTLRDGRVENFYFMAMDRAGNQSNISDVYQIRYDLTAPSKPIIENKYNDIWTNTATELTAKSSDSLSKVAKIEYSYDEINWKTDWQGNLQTNGNESSIKGTWNSNINKKIYVRATDNAGNISNVSSAIMKIDKTPPTVTLDKNGGTYTVAQNSNFVPITTKITAQDAGGSNLNNLQYQISSSSTIPADNDANWKDFTSGASITENKSGGTWYLYTKVTDHAGNRATHIQKSNPFVVKYSVIYDANGGTGTMPTDSVLYNTPYTTRANEFTREGYTFKGWNESPDGTGKDWTGLIGKQWTWTYNRSITLYAQWILNESTLTVNPNGGTWNGTTASSTFTQNYGSTKAIANPTAPAGYKVTFNGNGGSTPAAQTSTKSFTSWTNSGNGTLNGTTYTFGAGNGTLTANYKNNSITLPTPTRTGYTFAGWYDAASGGNKIGNGGDTYTPTTAKTLYAHWVDSTVPVMGMLTASPTSWTNGNVILTGRAQDLGSGISYYQFSTNGNLTSSSSGWISIPNTKNEIVKTYTVTTNGTYYFYVKDASGKVNKKSIIVSNIDKVSPTVQVSPIKGKYGKHNYRNVEIKVNLTAADSGGSGLNGLQYAWSTSSTTEPTSGWTNFTNGVDTTISSSAGKWYLWTKVTDKAGNRATNVQKVGPFIVWGWQTPSLGEWYYYSEETGEKLTGWQYVYHDVGLKDKKFWYYLQPDKDGLMTLGWASIDGKWYWFSDVVTEDTSGGEMQTEWQLIDGYWYFFNTVSSEKVHGGEMLTGWQSINGNWYYLLPQKDGNNPERKCSNRLERN